LSITFHLEIFGRHVTLARDAAASETLENVSLKLLRSTGIGDSLDGWEIYREEGEPLSFDKKVGELVRDRWSGNISVTLRLAIPLPGKGAEEAGAAADEPAFPRARSGAPITRHDMDVNDGEAETQLEEGSPPQKKTTAANGQSAAKPVPSKPKITPSKPTVGSAPAKPASKPLMTPPKPAAGSAPAKPASKPLMTPPKPAAGSAPAKPASKPLMTPPKPAKPPSKPMMAPPAAAKPPSKPMIAPAAKPPSKPMVAAAKPPSKPMVAPPAPQSPAPAAASTAAPPAPPKKARRKTDLIATEFDIPPLEDPGANVVAVNQVKEESRARQNDKTEIEFHLDAEQVVVDDEDADVDLQARSVAAPAKAGRTRAAAPTAEREATARYYNRMNPQRVYPLLVVISKQMIERAAGSGVDQKSSGPFKVALDAAIEIEPVLPGCYCYPPRATTRLGDNDVTLTFHVVPHVLGEVTGACIRVRQDHYDLTTIDLDMKVVQRTSVLLAGALTIGLPLVSSLARHFRFDVGGRSEDVLLLAMSTIVNYVPPYALMGGLAFVTLLAYWLTRARSKDAFFEVKPIGPDEKLAQISARLDTDPGAALDDLVHLLRSNANHAAARLVLADCHFRLGNYADSLEAYQAALPKVKTEEARHYLQAAQAAAKVGDWIGGSKILGAADEALTRERTGHLDFEELREQLRSAARQAL
jgi:hypothetical protein